MLGAKVTQVELIKVKADEARRLESERAVLFEQLEAVLSPEVAHQVEDALDNRRKTLHAPPRNSVVVPIPSESNFSSLV
jgi:hypothetical protein